MRLLSPGSLDLRGVGRNAWKIVIVGSGRAALFVIPLVVVGTFSKHPFAHFLGDLGADARPAAGDAGAKQDVRCTDECDTRERVG